MKSLEDIKAWRREREAARGVAEKRIAIAAAQALHWNIQAEGLNVYAQTLRAGLKKKPTVCQQFTQWIKKCI